MERLVMEIHSKSQVVRVIDVVFIAPVMIYAGVTKSNLPIFVRISLALLGVATLFYNAQNYIKINKIIKAAKANRAGEKKENIVHDVNVQLNQ